MSPGDPNLDACVIHVTPVRSSSSATTSGALSMDGATSTTAATTSTRKDNGGKDTRRRLFLLLLLLSFVLLFLLGSGFVWRYPPRLWCLRWYLSGYTWRWPPSAVFTDDEYPFEPPWTSVCDMLRVLFWRAPRSVLHFIFSSRVVKDGLEGLLLFPLLGGSFVTLVDRVPQNVPTTLESVHTREADRRITEEKNIYDENGRFVYRSQIGRQCAEFFHRAAEMQPLPGSGKQLDDGSCDGRSPVVLVSAYFEMGRLTRNACKYLSFMRQLLGVERHVVVFTQPKFVEVIREIRTEALTSSRSRRGSNSATTASASTRTDEYNATTSTTSTRTAAAANAAAARSTTSSPAALQIVEITSWSDFPLAAEFRAQMYENVVRPEHVLGLVARKVLGLSRYGSWLEALVPEYGLLQHAKIEFVHRAMEVVPVEQASHFFWVDAGALHGKSSLPRHWCPRRAMMGEPTSGHQSKTLRTSAKNMRNTTSSTTNKGVAQLVQRQASAKTSKMKKKKSSTTSSYSTSSLLFDKSNGTSSTLALLHSRKTNGTATVLTPLTTASSMPISVPQQNAHTTPKTPASYDSSFSASSHLVQYLAYRPRRLEAQQEHAGEVQLLHGTSSSTTVTTIASPRPRQLVTLLADQDNFLKQLLTALDTSGELSSKLHKETPLAHPLFIKHLKKRLQHGDFTVNPDNFFHTGNEMEAMVVAPGQYSLSNRNKTKTTTIATWSPSASSSLIQNISRSARERAEARYWEFVQHIERPIGTFWGGPREALHIFRNRVAPTTTRACCGYCGCAIPTRSRSCQAVGTAWVAYWIKLLPLLLFDQKIGSWISTSWKWSFMYFFLINSMWLMLMKDLPVVVLELWYCVMPDFGIFVHSMLCLYLSWIWSRFLHIKMNDIIINAIARSIKTLSNTIYTTTLRAIRSCASLGETGIEKNESRKD
ncbi:unnamed protein product [Amoebophrya sp. A25]|nr:unnamed protein product [Amoebophrya sp. A25]|eukprot:GSA25T00003201001.1